MELGTAVFLSAVLLSMVGLYAATKDRWNWKKILLWPLGVIVALAVLVGGGYYTYYQIDQRPKPQTSFWGIPLNATETEVRFLKGEPTKRDGTLWVYDTDPSSRDGAWYIVRFADDGSLRYVMYSGRGSSIPYLQGISDYSSQETILEKFGKPTNVSTSKDGLKRLLSYAKYNLVFELVQNRVQALGMYDGKGEAMRYSEEAQ
jgi:hypothetical protein